jgi:hypothetical protein
MKRKKRLKKGVDSMEEQIEIHKKKREKAEEVGMLELMEYYDKEIISKQKDLEKKKRLLDKQ